MNWKVKVYLASWYHSMKQIKIGYLMVFDKVAFRLIKQEQKRLVLRKVSESLALRGVCTGGSHSPWHNLHHHQIADQGPYTLYQAVRPSQLNWKHHSIWSVTGETNRFYARDASLLYWRDCSWLMREHLKGLDKQTTYWYSQFVLR